jgi:tetratricopeptide (TPR) repeat protein
LPALSPGSISVSRVPPAPGVKQVSVRPRVPAAFPGAPGTLARSSEYVASPVVDVSAGAPTEHGPAGAVREIASPSSCEHATTEVSTRSRVALRMCSAVGVGSRRLVLRPTYPRNQILGVFVERMFLRSRRQGPSTAGLSSMIERSGRAGGDRRTVVPPAPTWQRSEAAILRERVGAVGVALWQAARDVRLWAATSPTARRGLFRAAATAAVRRAAILEVPELEPPLEKLSALVHAPHLAQAHEIAAAAADVALWAEEAQLLRTALEFAEAAALADFRSSATASLAGGLARRSGENNRAAAWYRRAIALARGGDHDSYIRAQLGYGGVMFQVGNYPAARLAFRRASRLALKFGRRGPAAQANHDLLTIACDAGTYEEGAAAAVRALERYPVRHPRVPHLAHDFGYLLVRNGYFAAALPLLQRVLELVKPHERVVVCGTIARSAGAVGDRELFERTCGEVLRGVTLSEEFAAQALVHVAAGAQSLGDWELARRLATEAGEIARRRGNGRPALESSMVLAHAAARLRGDRDLARAAPVSIQLTAGAFLRRLEKFAPS